ELGHRLDEGLLGRGLLLPGERGGAVRVEEAVELGLLERAQGPLHEGMVGVSLELHRLSLARGNEHGGPDASEGETGGAVLRRSERGLAGGSSGAAGEREGAAEQLQEVAAADVVERVGAFREL